MSEAKMDEIMEVVNLEKRNYHEKMINLLEEYGEFR
tara:strand:- start:3260 stop:3367 length:108 start_codon:yes stop_codon:yes gene_type:complete